ncbi:hypothetical protein OIU78_011571 [Salix suchowensis]|nr:hypothetical protein OIU78_011571 [Salix suchowensis]
MMDSTTIVVLLQVQLGTKKKGKMKLKKTNCPLQSILTKTKKKEQKNHSDSIGSIAITWLNLS